MTKVIIETQKQFEKRVGDYLKRLDEGKTDLKIEETISVDPSYIIHIIIEKKKK